MEVSELLINNESADNPINWQIILESFDFDYLLDEYHRLINSQYFGDEDYGDNVIKVLSNALHDNEKNAMQLIRFIFNKYGLSSDKLNDLSNKYDFSDEFKAEINKKAFISYSNQNKEYCSMVRDSLYEIGLDGFLAHDDINVSREWADEIFNQLKETDIFIALLSKEFKESDYCSQEVGMALQRGCMIIPLSIDGTESYGFLNRFQSKHIQNISQMKSEIVNYYPYAMTNIILSLLDDLSLCWNYNKCNYLLNLISPHFSDFDENQVNRLIDITLRGLSII